MLFKKIINNTERLLWGWKLIWPKAATCGHLLGNIWDGHLRPLSWNFLEWPLATTCLHFVRAATCGHLLGTGLGGHLRWKFGSGHLRPHGTGWSGHLRPLAATRLELAGAAICGHLRPFAATCSHLRPLELLQAAASGCEWLRVAACW